MRLAASLDKDTVLAEGYKEFKTGRQYLAKMGDWRLNKDEEIELDGIGGVNILVKADVHRSGMCAHRTLSDTNFVLLTTTCRNQFPLLRI